MRGWPGSRLALLGLMLPALIVASCSRSSPPAGADRTPPDAIYTVRGRVAQLPEANNPAASFQVHHEPIDDWADAQGRVHPMDSMVMPLTVGAGVDLSALSVGDVIELTFEVRFAGSPRLLATAVRTLPADTPLNMGRAAPVSEEPEQSPPGG